jgi:WD40 repeat protein
MRLLDAPLRYILGPDIFFSYSRASAYAYTRNLADAIAERMAQTQRGDGKTGVRKKGRRISYYLDQLSSTPGRDLPGSLRRHLRRSHLLVLIATRQAVESDYVRSEVAEFLATGGPIVPINALDGGAEDDRHGVLRRSDIGEPWATVAKAGVEDEDLARITELHYPSDRVVARIEKALTFTLQENRSRRARWGTLAVVSGLLAMAALVSYAMVDRASQRAEVQDLLARVAQLSAQEAASAAARQRQLAADAVGEASRAFGLADDARRDALDSRTVAVAARLAAQNTVAAESRRETLERKLFLNMESMRRFPNVEAYSSLVSGLKLLPTRIGIVEHGKGHPGDRKWPRPQHVAFSEGRQDFLATTGNGLLRISRLGEASTGPITTVAEVPLRATPSSVQFSPGGEYLVVADGASLLRFARSLNFAQWSAFEHPAPIENVSFSSSGGYVATAAGNAAYVWRIGSTSKPVAYFPSERTVRNVALNDDGTLLATLDDNGIRLWDARCATTCKPTRTIGYSDYFLLRDLAFVPGGRYLFTATANQVHLWKENEVFRRSVDAYAVSPDGSYLVTASSTDPGGRTSVTFWDLRSPVIRELWHLNPRSPIDLVGFSADSQRVAITSFEEGETQVLDTAGKALVSNLRYAGADDSRRTYAVAISRDGRFVARGRGHSVEVWSTTGGWGSSLQLGELLTQAPVAIGGGYAAVAVDDSIALRDLTTTREVSRIATPCRISKLQLSALGSHVASAGTCGVFVWDTRTGASVGRLPEENRSALLGGHATWRSQSRYATAGIFGSIAISWEGQWLAVSSEGLRIHDVADRRRMQSLSEDGLHDPHRSPYVSRTSRTLPWSYGSLAFSADRTLIAAASASDVVIRKTASGEVVAQVTHPMPTIVGNALVVAFTSDARYLVTVDTYSARMWDLAADPREVARLDLRDELDVAPSSPLVSPDGRLVALVNRQTGTMRLLRWLPDDIMSVICARVSTRPAENAWHAEFGYEPVPMPCAGRS